MPTTEDCFALLVDTSVAVSSIAQLHDAISAYLSTSYGASLMCTLLLDNKTHTRAVCWVSSSEAAIHLCSQPLLHLAGLLSGRFTPVQHTTCLPLHRIAPTDPSYTTALTGRLSPAAVYKAIHDRLTAYTVFERRGEFLLHCPTVDPSFRLQGYTVTQLTIEDTYLLCCSWSGKSVTDLERLLSNCGRSLREVLQTACLLAGIDVCILELRITSFNAFVLVCASRLDVDLIMEKAQIDPGLPVGILGSMRSTQMFRSRDQGEITIVEERVSPKVSSTSAADRIIHICWNIDECSISNDDNLHELDNCIIQTASDLLGISASIINKAAIVKTLFTASDREHDVYLSARQTREFANLNYRIIFNSTPSSVRAELDSMFKRSGRNDQGVSGKPVVLALSGK
jgi:hypothetical protein